MLMLKSIVAYIAAMSKQIILEKPLAAANCQNGQRYGERKASYDPEGFAAVLKWRHNIHAVDTEEHIGYGHGQCGNGEDFHGTVQAIVADGAVSVTYANDGLDVAITVFERLFVTE